MQNLSPVQLIQKCNVGEFEVVEYNIKNFLVDVSKGKEIKINVSPDMMFGGMTKNQALTKRLIFINEWTALILHLFSSPKYKPSEDFLTSLIFLKHSFEWLFLASNWTTSDSLIDHLSLLKPNRKGILELNQNKLLLLMALVCLNSKKRLPWNEMMTANPAVTTTAYIALLNQFIPGLSKESMENFNHLLRSAKDFPMMVLPNVSEISKFIGSLFHSSYTPSPDKYEFKKWLTRLIRYNCERDWLSDENRERIKKIPKSINTQPSKQKKMLVMVEKLTAVHAMYRCYKLILESLSEVFHLVAIAQEEDLDEVASELFDEVCYLKKESELEINNKVTLVLNHEADVIYYPSIGMQLWSICLSQLRLAPKQIMMAGHPSSSFSQEIDHLLLPGNLISNEELQPFYTEEIITSNKSSKNLYMHNRLPEMTDEFIEKHNVFLEHDNNETINIGINGVITKVNYSIVAICKEIAKRSKKKVNFIFFTPDSETEVPYFSIYKTIAKELNCFELSAYSGYVPYLEVVSKCDFLLPTLPFGGSNSNIDAMIMSKPKLYIRGKEQIYTRTDQWEWERMGLDNELGCDTHEELIDKALRLISDDEYRHDLFIKMKEICTVDKIFDQESFSPEDVQNFVLQVLE